MSDHHPTLSPSSFPKLDLCIEFWPDPVSGPAAERGTMLHDQIRRHHEKGVPFSNGGAEAAYLRAKGYISDIRGVEMKMQLLDEDLNEVTFGTADMWGYHEGSLVLVDYKSGRLEDPASYDLQMAVYSLMLMERTGETSCISVIVGIDVERDHIVGWDYLPTQRLVQGVIDRVNAKEEEPKTNQYCKWCAKRNTCPARLSPALEVVSSTELVPADMKAMTFTRDWILASPENAARFLTAYRGLQEVVEKDINPAGFIKDTLLAGTPVEGWRLQHRKGSERLDTKAVKARWAELTDEPIPSSIGEATVSLVEA